MGGVQVVRIGRDEARGALAETRGEGRKQYYEAAGNDAQDAEEVSVVRRVFAPAAANGPASRRGVIGVPRAVLSNHRAVPRDYAREEDDPDEGHSADRDELNLPHADPLWLAVRQDMEAQVAKCHENHEAHGRIDAWQGRLGSLDGRTVGARCSIKVSPECLIAPLVALSRGSKAAGDGAHALAQFYVHVERGVVRRS